MTEETTQAVVDPTQAVAEPTAAEGNAQGNDLASFLTEYENGTKPQTQPVQQQPAQDPNREVLAEIQAFRQERAQEKHNKDYASAIKAVKGDFDVPDYVVRGWIDDKAENNAAIRDIWINRDKNPAALNRLLTGMKKEFAGTQKKMPDPEATADRAAVAAAVRGASTRAPEQKPVNLGSMNNAEFNAFLRENGIRNAV